VFTFTTLISVDNTVWYASVEDGLFTLNTRWFISHEVSPATNPRLKYSDVKQLRHALCFKPDAGAGTQLEIIHPAEEEIYAFPTATAILHKRPATPLTAPKPASARRCSTRARIPKSRCRSAKSLFTSAIWTRTRWACGACR